MNEPKTFRTAWLNNDYHTILIQSLPESFNDELATLSRRNLLQNIANDDQVKLASVTTGHHCKGIHPKRFGLELLAG